MTLTLEEMHQRAARLIRLNMLIPTPSREAATKTHSRGLPVIIVKTSPTRVVMVLVPARMVDRALEASGIPPF